TAQARNQDPLEPLDSSQYASQLAQFSMVEQQVQTNDLLSSLSNALGGVKLDELANWVGMDVRTASAFQFDGRPVTLFAAPDATADEVFLVVRSSDGTVIERAGVSPQEAEFVWAGTDSSGQPIASGTYVATLESYRDGTLLSENTAASYGRVREAQAGDDTVLLTLTSGVQVTADQVTAIRTGA
ncbi:MAG: flagellar hook capping FlgD N-terminal domain-containing protein, partial [Pseudomonadota bacterium]